MEDKMSSISEDVKKDNKKPMGRWTKSIKIGDDTTEIVVKELVKGFLVTKSHNYKDKDGWQYDDIEEYSETNPLADDTEATKGKSVKELYTGMFGIGESLT